MKRQKTRQKKKRQKTKNSEMTKLKDIKERG